MITAARHGSSPRCENYTPAELREAAVQFCFSLADALGEHFPVATGRRPVAVLWRDSEGLANSLAVRSYDSDLPILRLHANCERDRFPMTVARRLGCCEHQVAFGFRRPTRAKWSLELSLLPDDLLPLTGWLAEWIAARGDDAAQVATPPVPLERISPRIDYTWSVTAGELADQHFAESEFMRAERREWLARLRMEGVANAG